MRATCRRDGCWNATLGWLSDWCGPACQFADLDEAGVDMRMKTRQQPGPRYDSLRAHAGAEDWELVRDHEVKFGANLVGAAGGSLTFTPVGEHAESLPVVVAPIRSGKATARLVGWVDELNPPAPKPLPRTRRPLFAGLIRRLWP